MGRILVMEGNTLARQREAAELGVKSASAIYVEAIKAHFPDIGLDVIHAADHRQTIPEGAALSDFDGLVVGGSGLHAYETTFEVRNQIDLLRTFSHTGKPILGSCWGLQIAVIAAGGTVAPNSKGREFGFARKIQLNLDGRSHPMFAGKPDVFDAPCIHLDEVASLPSDATLLCSNSHSHVQGATVPLGASQVWAVQYHPEFDLSQIAQMIKLYGSDLIKQSFFTDSDDATSYIAKLDGLHAAPENKALAWQLGVDVDILNVRIRSAEIVNWIKACVRR